MFCSSTGIAYQVCAAFQEMSGKNTVFRRGSECALMNLMHKESLFKTEWRSLSQNGSKDHKRDLLK